MLILMILMLFPQIAFVIGVLTSSLGVGDRGVSGLVARGECHPGCVVGADHGCGREVLGRVSLRVSDRGCGWKVSRRMLLGLLLGV